MFENVISTLKDSPRESPQESCYMEEKECTEEEQSGSTFGQFCSIQTSFVTRPAPEFSPTRRSCLHKALSNVSLEELTSFRNNCNSSTPELSRKIENLNSEPVEFRNCIHCNLLFPFHQTELLQHGVPIRRTNSSRVLCCSGECHLTYQTVLRARERYIQR